MKKKLHINHLKITAGFHRCLAFVWCVTAMAQSSNVSAQDYVAERDRNTGFALRHGLPDDGFQTPAWAALPKQRGAETPRSSNRHSLHMPRDRDSSTTDNHAPALIVQSQDRIISINPGPSGLQGMRNGRYAYRILELSTDWKEIPNTNSLMLKRLPYGKIHIEIKTFNTGHPLFPDVLRYTLDVQRPFYLSWWFSIYILILLLAITLLFFHQRMINTRNLRKQRIQISRTLHDEVGGLITGIKMQTSQIKSCDNTFDLKHKINTIVQLSNRASASLWDTLWIIDARNDKLGNIVDCFREIGDMLLTPIHVRPVFRLEIPEKQVNVLPLVRQQLYLIYKEALNNIVRHAKPSYVHIHLKLDKKQYYLHIENDGAENRKEYTSGQGIKNMKYRAGLIHGQLNIDNTDGIYCLIVTS